MIAPPEPQRILSSPLDSSGMVPQFPVGPFLREEEFAGEVRYDEINRSFLEAQRAGHAVGVIGKIPFPGPPQLAHLRYCLGAALPCLTNEETSITETFHCEKLVISFVGNQRLPQSRAEWPPNFCVEI